MWRRWLVVMLPICLTLRAAAEDPASDVARTGHLQRMRELAGSLRVLADSQREESAVPLKMEPVLRYADSTRMTHESALWVWSNGGRPTAMLAVEYYPEDPPGPRWLYEIASLSTERIAAGLDGSFEWAAEKPGLDLQSLSDAPPPADKDVRRLVQMKELRNRFAAYEIASITGRLELRPLATPLLRYADAKAGLIDGAIFTFANGTNPEVLLVLEAQQVNDNAEWRYALVQMTGEPVTVLLDGHEIWKQPGDAPPAVRASYINGWIAAKTVDE